MEFAFHFVAFLDILGFSEMVRADAESPSAPQFLRKLLDVQRETVSSVASEAGFDVNQFSDSVVIALPFDKPNFGRFLGVVAGFQFRLFSEGLLCRGGITHGKHFASGSFVFSAGLVEAYFIERDVARYPRIAVSQDLLDLLFSSRRIGSDYPLLRERDGSVFVDFLRGTDLEQAYHHVAKILEANKSCERGVREKLAWLSEYFDYRSQQSSIGVPGFSENRFQEC